MIVFLFFFSFIIFGSEAVDINRDGGATSKAFESSSSRLIRRMSSAEDGAESPLLRLSGSSMLMPSIGFGTCCRKSANGPPLIKSVGIYLASGGRLIDTAQLYGNHKSIAVAIKNAKLPRADLWVTSKVNNRKTALTQADVVKAVDQSLEELGLDYIDLMLLHQSPTKWGKTHAEAAEEWKGLIEAQKAGKVRSIGVSNYNRDEIENLITQTGVTPANNQIEFHPWVPAETKELVTWCQANGISVTAYGSLGSNDNKANGALVDKIAQANHVSNAEVLLRWALDKNVAVIPGATSAEHIKENLQIASSNFHLSPADSTLLEGSAQPGKFKRWHNCLSGCAT